MIKQHENHPMRLVVAIGIISVLELAASIYTNSPVGYWASGSMATFAFTMWQDLRLEKRNIARMEAQFEEIRVAFKEKLQQDFPGIVFEEVEHHKETLH